MSTENIGLARLPSGFELVRIGSALRPEFAAWRYGDQFGRRRRRYIQQAVAGTAAVGVLFASGALAGFATWTVVGQSGNIYNLWNMARTRLRLRTDNGRVIKLKSRDLSSMTLVTAGDPDGWRVQIGNTKKGYAKGPLFTGEDAQRVAGIVLSKLNHAGGSSTTVHQAVRELEAGGGPEAFLVSDVLDPAVKRPADRGRGRRAVRVTGPDGASIRVANLPTPTRLALEMAMHEEQERRALEGELAALEAAWKEAEEIAAIADNLLVSPRTDEFLERHRPSGTTPS